MNAIYVRFLAEREVRAEVTGGHVEDGPDSIKIQSPATTCWKKVRLDSNTDDLAQGGINHNPTTLQRESPERLPT